MYFSNICLHMTSKKSTRKLNYIRKKHTYVRVNDHDSRVPNLEQNSTFLRKPWTAKIFCVKKIHSEQFKNRVESFF